MGLLGLLLREGKERAEDYAARKELEEKLGRRVTHEELYSLGSHLDAAETGAPPKPLNYTPREASTPFADAKPPMKLTTKLLLFGVPLILLVGFVGTFFVTAMPERTYNRLNPFTPKPPEGVFPGSVGDFSLAQKPDYNAPNSYNPLTSFDGEYKKDSETVRYKVSIYNSEAEAAAAYNKIKDGAKDGERHKVAEKSDIRTAIVALSGWNTYIYFKDGKYLKIIDSFSQKSALDFEGFLKNAPPFPITPVSESELKPGSSSTSNALTVLQLLDEFKKDPAAADKKYKGKIITVSGTVEVADKSKSGTPMLGFMRPGSTKPTDGMVICGFDKSQEAKILKIKKGDSVKVSGVFSMSLVGNIMLEKCSTF